MKYDYKVGMKVRVPDNVHYTEDFRGKEAYIITAESDCIVFELKGNMEAGCNVYGCFDEDDLAPVPVEIEDYPAINKFPRKISANSLKINLELPQGITKYEGIVEIDGQEYEVFVGKK